MSDEYPYIGTKVQENIAPYCLKEHALAEDFSDRLKGFVQEAVECGKICVIDGLDTYRGNEEALAWLFDMPGSIIVTLQSIGRFAPQHYMDAFAKTDNLVVL